MSNLFFYSLLKFKSTRSSSFIKTFIVVLSSVDYYQIMVTHLEQNGAPKIAAAQQKYMRDQFKFYGLKSPERRLIQKAIL